MGDRMLRAGRLLVLASALAATAAAPPSTPTPLTASFTWFDYRGDDPLPAGVAQRADDYRNPILAGFYPDPSVLRVGSDYYLVNSTFSFFPGLPVFHSRDLVHWTQIGNAIDRPDQVDFGGLAVSEGLFAPSISAHDGTFYIVNTCIKCGGNYIITATSPAGPWSKPTWLPTIGGIDPSLFFDDDGKAWIVHDDVPAEPPRYDGHRAIWIQQFDPATLKTVGPHKVLIDGGAHPADNPVWIEGPHLFRRQGWYYLIAAEGGTDTNHSEVVFRSKAVTGPYTPFADNPILTQRDLPAGRANPITSAGHASFVETPAGQWWATFLATRPYGNDLYNTGRETFLLPVAWRDGWPRVTAPDTTIPWVHRRPALPATPAPAVPTTGAFHVRQTFEGGRLPLDWTMVRTPRTRWYHQTAGRPGITLDARSVGLADAANPSFLARRQQHLDATATTRLRFVPRDDGDKAGIVAFQNDAHWFFLGIEQVDGKPMLRLERRAGAADPTQGTPIAGAALDNDGTPVELRIVTHGGRYDFLYRTDDDDWRALARHVDATILSTKVAGGFVGTMLGIYAYRAGPEAER